MDDWTAVAATVSQKVTPQPENQYSYSQVLAIAKYIIVCLACSYGYGRRSSFVSPLNRLAAMRLIFICQVLWYWSIALVKISVALLLLRIKPTRAWRIFLFSTIALLILTAVTSTFFQFLQCRPFSVYWDPSVFLRGGVTCIPRLAITGNITAASAVHVSTDLIFSFIPITFVRKLHRPTGEKIFLCILMGLGLFASSLAILRTAGVNMAAATPDIFRDTVMFTLWSMLELETALIAATIPTLKNFMQRSLIRLGRRFYNEESETQVRHKLVEMGFLESGFAKSGRKQSKPDVEGKVATFGSPQRLKIGKDLYGVTVDEVSVVESEVGKERRLQAFGP
jgi:hypothetical protein